MIVINIGNSYSKISGLSSEEHAHLKKLLSYKIDPQAAYFSGSFKTTRTLLGTRGDFPTGLLNEVREWSRLHFEAVHVVDSRTFPQRQGKLFDLTLGVTPYLEQNEAVEACIRRQRGTVSAVTGSGKSLMMAMLVNRLQLRTMIIVPNLALKAQLSKTFTEYFGSLKNITIKNIDDPSLMNEKNYDVLIVDEAHHVAAKTYRNLNKKAWTSICYRFFFTATPYRTKEEELMLMQSISGEVVYELGYGAAVASNMIVPVEAYYVECPRVDTDGYTWSEVYSDLVVNNEGRNKIIKDLMHSLQGQHVLTLVKEIKHGEWLKAISGTVFANGQDEYSKEYITQFSDGGIKSLIGTTGVMGEGVDCKPAEWVIIAGLGKSKGAFLQHVGRGIRKYPGKQSCKIIIFKDSSHRWSLAHFKAQVKYLKEVYGVKPIKLDVS